MLRIGYAQRDITPEGPIEMVGFGRADEMSRGTESPLLVQCAVFECGEESCCLLTMDSLGFSNEHSDILRDKAADELGLSRERVMICFSHTHSAPNESAAPGYFALVCKKALEAVSEAQDSMEEADAAWGRAHAEIAVSRSGGAVDDRIGVLGLYSPGGELKLLLLRLTAHCNCLKADNYLISPDYFGAVREMFSERFGCAVMATQGASGDAAPRYYKSVLPSVPDDCGGASARSETALDDMAREALRAAEITVKFFEPRPVDFLAMYTAKLRLWSDVPAMEEAEVTAREAKEICGIDGTEWLEEVRRLNSEGTEELYDDVSVQFFSVGGFTLCGLPYEVMCRSAVRLAERTDDGSFYFGGYTNGCSGYLPMKEDFDKGGYEVYWNLLTYWKYFQRVWPLRRDTESRIEELVVKSKISGGPFG